VAFIVLIGLLNFLVAHKSIFIVLVFICSVFVTEFLKSPSARIAGT